jgi:FkbM family methyltransferase
MKKVFFQIGTNNGNDQFRQLCFKYNPDLIVLVEANKIHLESINKHYSSLNNVRVFNNAIYYENDKDVELYIPAKDGVYGKKGENGITYLHGNFSLLPLNDWGEKKNMMKIIAKTITFDTICQKLNITDIEYLQIDTEGFDSEIIKMMDLNKYNIKNIRYEKWPFSEDKFTRYNDDKKKELGINGMRLVEEKLKKNGYTLKDIHDDDGFDIIATKKVRTRPSLLMRL